MEFVLNERLAAGGFEVTRKFGCRILLKNETNFPWFILVPEVPDGIEDLHQLDEEIFAEVMTGVRMTKRSTTIVMIVRKTNRIDQTHKLSHSRTNLKVMLV